LYPHCLNWISVLLLQNLMVIYEVHFFSNLLLGTNIYLLWSIQNRNNKSYSLLLYKEVWHAKMELNYISFTSVSSFWTAHNILLYSIFYVHDISKVNSRPPIDYIAHIRSYGLFVVNKQFKCPNMPRSQVSTHFTFTLSNNNHN